MFVSHLIWESNSDLLEKQKNAQIYFRASYYSMDMEFVYLFVFSRMNLDKTWSSGFLILLRFK